MALLELEDLAITYRVDKREYRAVNDVNYKLEKGESMALVGESGSGKSTVGLSLMGLLPENARVASGTITFKGKNIVGMQDRELRSIRWKQMSMIFQGSMNALDPIQTIGRQLMELIRFHERMSKADARPLILDMIQKVGLKQSVVNLYPHEMSGGMKQRVVIAMALLLKPDLLIADEPTTALDVTTQAEIIIQLKHLIEAQGMSVIFITHDLSLVPQLCKKVVILYGGTTMESGTVSETYATPMNPYTKALMGSIVSLTGKPAQAVPGDPPTLQTIPDGCPFNTRCPSVFAECFASFPKEFSARGRIVRCHLFNDSNKN